VAKTILFKRGTEANLPDLQEGEPGWAKDTKQFYVGDGSGAPVKVGTEVSDFMDTVLDDANAAAVIATLGLDADLATLSLPASTTISAFGKTIVDDANAAAVIATLGLDADLATFTVPANTTISAFSNTFLDDTTALAFRTTVDAQRNLGEYNIEDYGAVGNSSAVDNKTAFDDTVTACPAGATIYIPPKSFWLKTAWTCDKQVNIRGAGIASQIIVATGTGTVAITVGNTSTYTEAIQWRNFAILGEAASCYIALLLRKVNRSVFDNIHVCAGTDNPGFGVFINWSVCNDYNFIISSNIVYPDTITAVPPKTGICAQSEAGAAEVCNANLFNCIIEGCTGEGLYVYTSGINGNNRIKGTYEGITGYSIHIKGGTAVHLYDLHSEGSADSVNEIALESTSWAQVGPGMCSLGTGVNPDILLLTADNTHFLGGFCTEVSIDAASSHTRFVSFSYVTIHDAGSDTLKTTFGAL
jgi:hypothetical protein